MNIAIGFILAVLVGLIFGAVWFLYQFDRDHNLKK